MADNEVNQIWTERNAVLILGSIHQAAQAREYEDSSTAINRRYE